MSDPTAAMRTKRKYAHELYPHPATEDEIRPLHIEVPYLYARAVGLDVWGTSWFDLRSTDDYALQYASQRTVILIAARKEALLADALLQGLRLQDAWNWAEQRAADETGECTRDRAEHYKIPFESIKPYPCGPEPDHHSHYDLPDARGWRTSHRISVKESECPECCEPVAAPATETTDV